MNPLVRRFALSPGLTNIDLYLALAIGIWLNVPQLPSTQAGYPKCTKSVAHVGVAQSVLAKWETAQITTLGLARPEAARRWLAALRTLCDGARWPGGDRIAGRGLRHVMPVQVQVSDYTHLPPGGPGGGGSLAGILSGARDPA